MEHMVASSICFYLCSGSSLTNTRFLILGLLLESASIGRELVSYLAYICAITDVLGYAYMCSVYMYTNAWKTRLLFF